MELTQSNDVFNRVAMVLFLCRNKSSRNVLKIYGDFFWNKRKIHAQRSTGGDGPVGHKPCSRHPLVAASKLVGPMWLCRPQTQLYKFTFAQKNQKRRFHRVCDMEAPPHPVLHLEDRSGVRFGLRRGEIIAIVIINFLPSPIP